MNFNVIWFLPEYVPLFKCYNTQRTIWFSTMDINFDIFAVNTRFR